MNTAVQAQSETYEQRAMALVDSLRNLEGDTSRDHSLQTPARTATELLRTCEERGWIGAEELPRIKDNILNAPKAGFSALTSLEQTLAEEAQSNNNYERLCNVTAENGLDMPSGVRDLSLRSDMDGIRSYRETLSSVNRVVEAKSYLQSLRDEEQGQHISHEELDTLLGSDGPAMIAAREELIKVKDVFYHIGRMPQIEARASEFVLGLQEAATVTIAIHGLKELWPESKHELAVRRIQELHAALDGLKELAPKVLQKTEPLSKEGRAELITKYNALSSQMRASEGMVSAFERAKAEFSDYQGAMDRMNR